MNITTPDGIGKILGPDGTVVTTVATTLTLEEATLLRAYKKFLQRHGLTEALYCTACWERNLANGLEAHVTDTDILLKCRCHVRAYKGQSG